MKNVLYLCSCVAILCFCWTTFGLSPSDNRIHEISASPGQTLILDLETGGDLEIRGWNKNSVAVNADLSGSHDCCVVEMNQVSAGVRLHTGPKHSSQIQTYTNLRFQIDVPRNFNIELKSAGGDLKITRVNGRMKGSTGGGKIVIRNSDGEAHLSTGGGDIQVIDSHMDGEVGTGGGEIRFHGVTGDIEGSTGGGEIVIRNSDGEAHLSTGGGDIQVIDSHMDGEVGTGGGEIRFHGVTGDIEGSTGSGTVIRNQPEGKAKSERTPKEKHPFTKIDKAGGSIQIADAPDGIEASTGGGDIHVGSAKHTIAIHSGGGDIKIDSADGEVNATTGAGDIVIHLFTTNDSGSHDVDLRSGTGDITLIVPPSFPMQLDLKIGYTNEENRNNIISDFPVQKTYTKKWSDTEGTPRKYIYGSGAIGSGTNHVRIFTVNGSIYLKKSS